MRAGCTTIAAVTHVMVNRLTHQHNQLCMHHSQCTRTHTPPTCSLFACNHIRCLSRPIKAFSKNTLKKYIETARSQQLQIGKSNTYAGDDDDDDDDGISDGDADDDAGLIQLMERHSYEVVSVREGFNEDTPFLLPLIFLDEHEKYGISCNGVVDAEDEKILLIVTSMRKLWCITFLITFPPC